MKGKLFWENKFSIGKVYTRSEEPKYQNHSSNILCGYGIFDP